MTTALIADDEPLLLDALQRELLKAWPELTITSSVGDGGSAIDQLLLGRHDIAFLDINMPVANGIAVMQTVIEEWPEITTSRPPAFVFVSAHEEFALDAFELAAIDYILKPVSAERLGKTIERLKNNYLTETVDQMVKRFANLLDATETDTQSLPRLQSVPASVGTTVRLIPINDVILFEASAKYVVVHTANQEVLIREPLRSLLPRLDPRRFQQIHRSSIVNMDCVESALKFDDGKMLLKLNGIDHQPKVSRVYRHLFQPM